MASDQWSVLRFDPVYQERVWGGRRLETLYGRQLPREDVPYGESWEICDRPEVQSVVKEGPEEVRGWTLQELWSKKRQEVFGARMADHPAKRFPLLLKILDASEDLSIQVHPHDDNAAAVNGEAKSEAWYVAHAEADAKLYAGLNEGVTAQKFQTAMTDGALASQVREHRAFNGGCVAIPGGVVHAIGAGVVIYEIQQNSDTTYRVFDWNRLGLDGKPRELHQDAALQVIHFDAPSVCWQRQKGTCLLDWSYFRLDVWQLSKFEERQVPGRSGEFVIGAVVEGEIGFEGMTLGAGDFFLVPAAAAGEARCFKVHSSSAKVLWVTM